MKHFSNLSREIIEQLFHSPPSNLNIYSNKNELGIALGATLYTPSTRPNLTNDVIKNYSRGATSVVICLEDAIADNEVELGESNIREHLPKMMNLPEDSRPLIFIRVRSPEQLERVIKQNYGSLDALCGFVFPKFGSTGAMNNEDDYCEYDYLGAQSREYVEILLSANKKLAQHGRKQLFFMPVLESPELAYLESRMRFLYSTKKILDEVKDIVLAVRIGATDLSSVYGMRRSRDMVIYDSGVIASAIYDVSNYFTRFRDGYQVTGAVWEHFNNGVDRLFKPKIRQTLFSQNAKGVRAYLIKNDLDKLIEEVRKDRVNNLMGKTVIHPSHVPLVNSLSTVAYEDYLDALAINEGDANSAGAVASHYRNKMNEQKPHSPWAKKILERAKIYGVLKEGIDPIDLVIKSLEQHSSSDFSNSTPENQNGK